MSTDVYFDFHSPTTYPLYQAWDKVCGQVNREPGAWEATHKAWCDSIKERGQYDPCAVAHLHNLCQEVNNELWDAFRMKWRMGMVVTEENIPQIVADWKVLYDNTQNSEDEHMKEEMLSPEEMEEMLREYIGFHLEHRVD